ncbi:MAG: HlyD family efflux transporter periplasmic adaptor subunit [Oscillospiraceae bacterium]|nr:HlyD family efflux transporter periplasmic adaptor subunit [Oscillospiraceae bacterium]
MRLLKKKWVIGFILLLAVAAAAAYGVTRPIRISVAEISPKEVKQFFTEEGYVNDETTFDVYSLHSGSVLSIYVKENQYIEKGGPLCLIDESQLRHELVMVQNGKKGLLAQIEDLDLREKQSKDEQRINIGKLQGEYEMLAAEENSLSKSNLSAKVTKEDQLNLQNIIIEQSRANLADAREDLLKIEALYAAGAVTRHEVDDQRALVDGLENSLSQSSMQFEIIRLSNETQSREEYFRSAKKSIQEQISAIDDQLDNTYTKAMKDYYQTQLESADESILLLKKQIEECTVIAPNSGVVTKLNVDKSNVAAADVPVATISTGFEANIEVYVPTSDIGSVNIGDEVELELRSDAGAVYGGVVTEIDDKAIVQTSSLGVEKRKVKVTIRPLPEHIHQFKPGYDLSVSFITYFEENLLTVPRTAVAFNDDIPFVWVITDGMAERREIVIDRELKVDYVVKSGVSAGELIVKDAMTPGLKVGQRVVGVV